MTLGEKLQRLRKARRWTQEQLAEKVGVSRQSLSGWENDASLPDTANVIALADLFGVTTDYLLRPDAQGEPASAPAPSPATQARWRMSRREMGARLIIAAAGTGLVTLRVMASFYPAQAVVDGRTYTGFAGFLQTYDLWWALWLLVIGLTLGLVQGFGPWLQQKAKKLMRRKEE